MSNIDKQAIDFSQPLETESGEPVKYICHDVIEYKCARVCVDIATGIVYSSPYVGLKIRNKEANPRSKLREQIESAADAYWQFDNGWISDMKCGDLSHEYLLFAKEPKNVLALLDELEAARQHIAELESKNGYLRTIAHEQNELAIRASLDSINDAVEIDGLHKRIAELEAREVTLPQRLQPGTDGYDDWYVHSEDDGEYLKADDVIEAIRAAGIKVKGE
ncbi:ead/Ea22-like family protein [Salmonella enterica subsp. enterica serovar Oslo]|nr:ead/Ea22-like family protein [Salmonella enterica subsp. enterica serovar Oslo]